MTKPSDAAFASEVDFGLTFREYAAVHAMQGLLTDPESGDRPRLCKAAVEHADALIAELEKTQ